MLKVGRYQPQKIQSSHLKCILFTPKILYNHCYQFLLGITVVPREIEDNGYANFWGTNKVHYGLCENSELYHLCLLLNNANLGF